MKEVYMHFFKSLQIELEDFEKKRDGVGNMRMNR